MCSIKLYADGQKKLCMRNGAAIFTILNQSLQFFVTFIDNLGLCPCSRKWFNINDVIFYDVTTQWGSNNSSQCQRCVWPPRALTHSWHRRLVDATRLAWNACGISCQTSCLCDVTFGRPDRGLSLPIPVVWKRLQRELMVFLRTSNRRATSRWGVPAWIIPMARWRASVHKRDMMLSARRQWWSVKMCFSGTSKHSQHPCALTRCRTRMTEAANSKWSIYQYC